MFRSGARSQSERDVLMNHNEIEEQMERKTENNRAGVVSKREVTSNIKMDATVESDDGSEIEPEGRGKKIVKVIKGIVKVFRVVRTIRDEFEPHGNPLEGIFDFIANWIVGDDGNNGDDGNAVKRNKQRK